MMSMMKQKIQKMTTESLSLVGVQRKNGNTAGTFFNMLEKVVTAKIFLTHLEIFSILKEVAYKIN